MNNPSALAREFMEKGVLAGVPIIDAHAHMGAVYGTSLTISGTRDMVALMDRENIEMIFCSPHSALFDPGAMNTELEKAMALYPGRIRGYFAYNPNYAADMLPRIGDVMTNPGYIGFKLLPEYHRYSLAGEAFAQVLDYANAHRRVVLVHTWGGSAYNSPRQAEEVLRRHPELTLILGHSAPGELEGAIRLAREYENVYLDLCDIHRHNGIIERMVRGAGADKVLFGTDIPWYDPNYCLGSILFARISDEDRVKIIRGNALRILRQADAAREQENGGKGHAVL